MTVAHARGGSCVSEKAIEVILGHDAGKKRIEMMEQMSNKENLADFLEKVAVLNLPVGSAAQDAAIAAIGVLGENETLTEVAIRGLESLRNQGVKPEIVTPYLEKLKQLSEQRHR